MKPAHLQLRSRESAPSVRAARAALTAMAVHRLPGPPHTVTLWTFRHNVLRPGERHVPTQRFLETLAPETT